MMATSWRTASRHLHEMDSGEDMTASEEERAMPASKEEERAGGGVGGEGIKMLRS